MRPFETNHSRPGTHHRGVALIWVAVSALMLIAFVGLAVDGAYVYLTVHQLQNGADAGGLAGVLEVRDNIDEARQAAVDAAYANSAANAPILLDRNDSNGANGDVVIGRYNRRESIFTPFTEEDFATKTPNAVEIRARRTTGSAGGPLALVFGPIFDFNAAEVARRAIAIIAGTTGGGLITLCPDCVCSLHIHGNVTVDVDADEGYDGQAAVQVNSDDANAMCCDGNSLIVEVEEINLVGDAESQCYSRGLDTYIEPESPEIPDPLAGLQPPPCGTQVFMDVLRDGTPNAPGYYRNGITMTSKNDRVDLAPGIYCVDGNGLDVRGGTLSAEGVMFYVIDGTSWDNIESHVYLGGKADVTITPIADENDPYWGISIFQARDNHNESTIIGTSDLNLDGTLYFPGAPLEVGGDGVSLGNQLIAWTLRMHGSGTFDIQYDGRFPAAGSKVFLVE